METPKTPNLQINGDTIERFYYSFIKEKIQYYENIWSAYIGNNGNNTPSEIPGLPEEDESKRRKFSQYHYTCLLCLLSMKQAIEKLDSITIENGNAEAYLEVMNWFTVFMAHAGKVRDLTKKMGELFRDNNLSDKLDELYKQRSVVMHDTVLPFYIEDGIVSIIPPQGKDEDDKRWSKDKIWREMKSDNLKFMKDYVKDILNDILYIVNSALASLHNKILNSLNGRRCVVNDQQAIPADSSATLDSIPVSVKVSKK